MTGRAVLGRALALWLVACGGCDAETSPAEAPEVPASEPAPAEAPAAAPEPPEAEPAAPAASRIVIDTHVDTPQRMVLGDDITERLPGGHLDLPRMREGGLDAAFFSVWVDPRVHEGEAAWTHALALIEAIRSVPERAPERAVLCERAECIRQAKAEGRVALLIGVEGAHALGRPPDDDAAVERIRQLYALGARYMTLTWTNDNALAHASTGGHSERGLTPLGRRAIREMNRLGMIIDVSHVSDRTFWETAELSRRPLLASHSSARGLADHPRNVDDAMIRRIAEGGGAVCVNFYSQFIDDDYRARRRAFGRAHAGALRAAKREEPRSWLRIEAQRALFREADPPLTPPSLDVLIAHFERVTQVGGPGAACLGSDFDGVTETPAGLEDVRGLPALLDALTARGLPVDAIAGGNVLRVLEAHEASLVD